MTKFSSCLVNTTSRQGIKLTTDFFWFYFSSISLLKKPGAMFLVAGVNPRLLPLNDSPDKTQHELSDVVSDK